MAHVDHGKTSLTDVLLATNGVISPKMAGKIRYLDSRQDEQTRGITMESSAISLYFSMLKRSAPEAEPVAKEYLVNLIDSPGHIDFSSEVSTASRLCDGAVVLVDAVEGVCSQTVTVLRQVWIEKLKPLLVINKMDRLITELKMTPEEAYTHLSKQLEQVNAVLGSFYQGDRMEEDLNWREKMEARVAAAKGGQTAEQKGDVPDAEYEEKDDEDIYFAPERNNVIFASAIDGWAFTVRQFAGLYEKKLGIKRSTLQKVLWGNFYLDPKTKKLLGPKHLKGRPLKPLFAQLVLEPIWTVYKATVGVDDERGDQELLQKVTKSLNVTIPSHVLRSRDPRMLLTAVFASWLPLSTALLVSVVESLPPPNAAQAERVPDLLDDSPGGSHINPTIRDAMVSFKKSKSDPVVAYVSKMVSVPESELPQNKRKPGQMSHEEARLIARKKRAEAARAHAASTAANGDEADLMVALDSTTITETPEVKEEEETEIDVEHLVGFARIYSGTLSVGDTLYHVPPKWSPAEGKPEDLEKIEVTNLYMFMGRNLEALDTVPAGVVFGIGGLEGRVLKSGTLCSTPEGAVNLAGVNTAGKPIVRVAVEPENPADLDRMIEGLRLLVQSDPCAEYEQFESGEHVLLTAGELHLERCIKDLQERFARCVIQVGAPIVPYRETIVRDEEMRPPANKELGRGVVAAATSSKQFEIRLHVEPLPREASEFLVRNGATIRQLHLRLKGGEENGDNENDVDSGDVLGPDRLSPEDFKKQLQSHLGSGESAKEQEHWRGVVDRITAFGPRRIGPNILIDATEDQTLTHLLTTTPASHPLNDKIVHAFQLAAAQGPLCAEPMQGVAVVVEALSCPADATDPRLTGEVIKTTQRAIHAAFLDWSPRLMLARYTVEIQATLDVLGRTNDVLTRRRARIVDEAMNEGTPFYSIRADLPVAESFGFADEMRKKTSGAAQPQLIFAGFEVLDEDPLWQPFTEDELEDLGEWADRENFAKRYMDGVRRRKGMLVEGRNEATVATKQKTLKR